MESKIKTLQERIEEMAKRAKASELEICWNYYNYSTRVEQINQIYDNPNVSPIEKFSLTEELLKLWFSGDEKICSETFGDIYDYYKKNDKSNVFATLTGNQRELRVWVKPPVYKPGLNCDVLGSSHVDGFLERGIFHLNGLGNPIDNYIGLIEEMIAPAFKMPYGGALFAKKRELLPSKYETPSGYVRDIDFSNFKEVE